MAELNPFFDDTEQETVDRFLRDGFLIFPLADPARLDAIRGRLHGWAESYLGRELTPEELFDDTASLVGPDYLNNFRLNLIGELTADPGLRPDIFRLAREMLHLLVGNELAMQRGMNLSIQMPDDDSSLLALHSDIWSGNSPYEVVFWLPLVDCTRTKSMYVLPKADTDAVYADFAAYSHHDAEGFYEAVADRAVFLDVPFGHAVIFWHGLIHGNRVNRETTTRWTMNVRFKSLLTPYGTKEMGESFLPITIRPMTRIGHAYRKPEVAR